MKTRYHRLTPRLLAQVARQFRALGVDARLRLLAAMREGEARVQTLADASALSQANASKHLGVLKTAGLVVSRREGLHTLYRIASPDVNRLCDIVCAGVERQLRADHAQLPSPARRPPGKAGRS